MLKESVKLLNKKYFKYYCEEVGKLLVYIYAWSAGDHIGHSFCKIVGEHKFQKKIYAK